MRAPGVPVYGNVGADLLRTVEAIKAELTAQITSPVRWREISAKIITADPGLLVEIGPGKTLGGLILRWLRKHADAKTLSRWMESIHLHGSVKDLRLTREALVNRRS